MVGLSVTKKAKIESLDDIIRFQLLTYCFLNKIKLSDSEMSCLVLLTIEEEMELSKFCIHAVNKECFNTTQSVRNFITKAERLQIVIKNGTSKKKITINPEAKIISKGNIIFKTIFGYVQQ